MTTRGMDILQGKAYQAVSNVHTYRFATLEETLDALESIREHVDELISAVKEDIERLNMEEEDGNNTNR